MLRFFYLYNGERIKGRVYIRLANFRRQWGSHEPG